MPSLSVSQFVDIFNQSIDMMYPAVGIVGELANFRISKGMWVYFDLKDEDASVRFFGTTKQLPGPLQDGMNLEVVGRPYLHPKFGFSIQINFVQAVGEGSIKKAQDLLAQKLEKEGLFDDSRKRLIPFPPRKVALITSSESAAYSDFIKIIQARWPRLEIDIYEVQVQGQSAPAQLVAALEQANQANDLEALVMIRGGGSKDDLVAFDHELVVRAVAGSRIPTLVAIGHERDISLAERAADKRASTPSNAAELLVPDRMHESLVIQSLKDGADSLLADRVKRLRDDVLSIRSELGDYLSSRVDQARSYNDNAAVLLSALDPLLPLQRGYVLARSSTGKVVKNRAQAEEQAWFNLEFTDGKIAVQPAKGEYNK